MSREIEDKVEEYYSGKLEEFGTTSQGVDWNGEESQFLRFRQLAKLFKDKGPFGLLDYGCGFGSLVEFLDSESYSLSAYAGYDLSEKMLEAGRKKYADEKYSFTDDLSTISQTDYCVASGLFNVKLETTDSDWTAYIQKTLVTMNEKSSKGFAFNILTSYSDEEYKKDYLHYADPREYFDYCKKNFSRNVALLHDYDLFEFTILVRKD